MGEYKIEYRRIGSIQPAERNYKQHEIGEICTSIASRGFVGAAIIDDRTNRLIAGHGRLEALCQLYRHEPNEIPNGIRRDSDGAWLVPCITGWSSADDIAALQALIADNALVEAGDMDRSELADMLKDLAAADALIGVGYDGDDLDALIREIEGSLPVTEASESMEHGPTECNGTCHRCCSKR